MWSSIIVLLLLIIKYQNIEALSCYQCSMKYSNEECNSNNSTYATECQPTFDTCVTIVLKPAILNQLLITKYCTKRKACERQLNYIHSLTSCRPNDESRSWGCVTCCGDRDLCNYDDSNILKPNLTILLIVFINCFFYGY
ncbi:unnamed protein product [Rotaria sp. Silwood1]|nr:unnamed protein product [Rotaria sp. Silwood1]CAF3810271.1 unnamed protein product [Rotaria sp. Silwood1]CAF3854809.1 unnamed protein product [Rotaria sp. Silwood1]CAF4795575.1 unnamed protein product [Rotaria sp. Silwood1]CAF4913162.1 unnamed protein product [Rotaria sp. Silwood1]